jgi:subtilase family protein
MRRRLLLCGVLGACAGDASLAAPDQSDQIEQEIFDRGATVVLVTLRPSPGKPGAGAFAETLDGVHAQPRRSFHSFPGAVVRVDAEGYRALRARADVVTIEPDLPVTGQLIQSVPLIRADQTQADGNDGAGVAVAILDSGMRATHEDLVGALLGSGQHFLSTGAGPGADDDQGHGSNVAGIVAGRGVGTSIGNGVAPAARIVPVKVLDSQNRGSLSDWIAGVDWVVQNQNTLGVPIRVINMSLGTDTRTAACPCDSDPGAAMMGAALAAARAAGILVVASSGNQGDTSQLPYPACFSTVLAVAATYDSALGPSDVFGCLDQTTSARLLTCFSNRNACVALAAPGANITSAGRTSDTALATFIGTSQAAPHVAGMAAVIWGKYPSLTVDQVQQALLTSTTTVDDPILPRSYVFLDAVDSLAAAECATGCTARNVCENASCDASDLCQRGPKPPGATCGPTTCAGANLTLPTCNADGNCADVTTSCGMYACNSDGNACLTRCVLPGDCADGATCESRACVAAQSDGGGGCQTSHGAPSFATLLFVSFLLWRLRWTRSSRSSSVPAVRRQ